MKVEEIMSTPVVAVTPGATLRELSQVLVDNGISGVPVINEDNQVVGIVSEADLLPFETKTDPVTGQEGFPHSRAAERHVGEVMQRSVITLPREADAHEAATLIIKHGVKRIPIVSHDRLVGIVSRHDVMEALAELDELRVI